MSEQAARPSPSSSSFEAERQTLTRKLFETIRFDEIDNMRALLHGLVDPSNIINNIIAHGEYGTKETALTLASYRGKTEAIKMLLAAKAEVNLLVAGESALHIAASAGKAESVSLLLKAKADIHQKREHRSFSEDALMIAKSYGHTQVVEILSQAKAAEAARQSQELAALGKSRGLAFFAGLHARVGAQGPMAQAMRKTPDSPPEALNLVTKLAGFSSR